MESAPVRLFLLLFGRFYAIGPGSAVSSLLTNNPWNHAQFVCFLFTYKDSMESGSGFVTSWLLTNIPWNRPRFGSFCVTYKYSMESARVRGFLFYGPGSGISSLLTQLPWNRPRFRDFFFTNILWNRPRFKHLFFSYKHSMEPGFGNFSIYKHFREAGKGSAIASSVPNRLENRARVGWFLCICKEYTEGGRFGGFCSCGR